MSNNTEAKNVNTKRMTWYTLAFMAFSTVWGFGNVVNGFGYFNGTQVIFSWILMFVLYFVPYALMVGELGSAFKNLGGGVTSWVLETTNPKLAYYAGYTYWVVHIPYIASKGSGGLKALAWMCLKNSWYDALPTWQVQLATAVVFLLFCWIATRGLSVLKPLASLAGTTMFAMSLLYILMMFAAPAINPAASFSNIDWSWENIIPQFNVQYFTSLSILVFAVGGCEKISPYVNKVENPAKNFPKGMIALAIMVMVCAILGTIAMALVFSPVTMTVAADGTIAGAEVTAGSSFQVFALGQNAQTIKDAVAAAGSAGVDPVVIDGWVTAQTGQDFAMAMTSTGFIANGQYEAMRELGGLYHVGNLFVILYGACNAIGQFSTLTLSIDAPLRMLLDDENARQYVPKALLKQNRFGAYTNGILLIVVLSGAIIAIQLMGSGASDVIAWLTRLNSVCMPMRYLWVFFAYIMLRRQSAKFPREYEFVKNNGVALFFGFWCFFVTAACCLMGTIDLSDMGRTVLNIAAPIVYLLLGMIMPMIRKREDEKGA
ncbi:APC family permease [Faecalibaculum rodentium]|uniref:APC family permease n=1 Tax=Faecalibaculum rodentium TaxID=1702221 RepID=UPI0023F23A5D|nr:amino acid permease [Faecalibaculum rodentium]